MEKKQRVGKKTAKVSTNIPTLVYVTEEGLIGKWKDDLYEIVVTENHAVISSRYFRMVYDNPTLQYQYVRGAMEKHINSSKTEDEEKEVESLFSLFPNILTFHFHYYSDPEFCSDMYKLHQDYIFDKLEKAMSEDNLSVDDPNFIKELQDLTNLDSDGEDKNKGESQAS